MTAMTQNAPLYTVKMGAHPLDKWVAHIKSKHPNAVVINALPKDQALVMLLRAA